MGATSALPCLDQAIMYRAVLKKQKPKILGYVEAQCYTKSAYICQ